MAKFVIECPKCGKYAQASSGLFGFIGRTRKVDCACGHTIDVDAEKLSSRECPHCGNNVVFDQSKGEKALCPVCGEPVNTMAEQNKTVEFSCAQCGIRLRTAKGAKTYRCPVCDHENPVAERVMNEELKKNGKASVIKYEGNNDTLVWKHPIEDFYLGSQLIVHESQEAIFFRDGQALDLFGAGRYTLETQKLPLLDKLYELPLDTDSVFHSEVYYINTATQMGIKWGLGQINLFEPTFGIPVELGVRGEFNARVINSRKLLLKLVGTTKGLRREQLLDGKGNGYFREMVVSHVRSYLASAIKAKSINLLEIDQYGVELADALKEQINPHIAEYGLEITEFFIAGFQLPTDPDFIRAKKQYAEESLNIREQQIQAKIAVAEAQRITAEGQRVTAEAQNRILAAQGEAEAYKIKEAAKAAAYQMQAAAEAEEMRMKGYTYQQETARQVGLQAMQNGITGNGIGAPGGMGDIASFAMTLGTMGSMVGMAKDALSPVMDTAAQMGHAVGGAISGTTVDTWDCACGNRGIKAKFCGECGAKRPEPKKVDTWDCACGNKGITGKFCGECGAKRPVTAVTWDCFCGNKGISGKFCTECGAKRPEPATAWDCSCGQKGILGKFCPECGNKKGE